MIDIETGTRPGKTARYLAQNRPIIW